MKTLPSNDQNLATSLRDIDVEVCTPLHDTNRKKQNRQPQ